MPLKRLGCAVPVIALTLAGCAESVPQRYTHIYTSPAPAPNYAPPDFKPPPVVPSAVGASSASDPPPLRPIDPDPPAPWHWPSWSAPSADDGVCTGWWSICQFFPR
jgi:hypothetical protein